MMLTSLGGPCFSRHYAGIDGVRCMAGLPRGTALHITLSTMRLQKFLPPLFRTFQPDTIFVS